MLNEIAIVVCGDGYVVDWEAISSVASTAVTTAAVIAALYIANRDRRDRGREKGEFEARAA